MHTITLNGTEYQIDEIETVTALDGANEPIDEYWRAEAYEVVLADGTELLIPADDLDNHTEQLLLDFIDCM